MPTWEEVAARFRHGRLRTEVWGKSRGTRRSLHGDGKVGIGVDEVQQRRVEVTEGSHEMLAAVSQLIQAGKMASDTKSSDHHHPHSAAAHHHTLLLVSTAGRIHWPYVAHVVVHPQDNRLPLHLRHQVGVHTGCPLAPIHSRARSDVHHSQRAQGPLGLAAEARCTWHLHPGKGITTRVQP